MCRWSSAFGISRSSRKSRSREIVPKSIVAGTPPSGRLLLVAARHLAFDALDEEVDAAQELVVRVRAGGHHHLAVVAGDRAFPDDEAAVLEAGLDRLDLGLDLGWHLVGDRDEIDRAFLDAPPRALVALPGAVEHGPGRLDVVRRPVDDGRCEVRIGRIACLLYTSPS